LRVLRQDSRTQNTPVTILSADATPSQAMRLQAAGAREYLTKPLDVKQIISLLEDTLRREEPANQPNRSRLVDETPARAHRWAPEPIRLSGLATELLEQLRLAVQNGEKDRLDELIAMVANQDSGSANALRDLADKYEYDALIKLLTEVSKHPEAAQ
jgi:DNA-binding response OmpR family regulator